ncbi:unnamed protein product, partial [Symbiodinium necroappetens]
VNPGVHIYVYRFNKIEFGGTCYCERQLWRTPPREAEETPTHVVRHAGVQRSLRLDPQLQCLLRIPGRLHGGLQEEEPQERVHLPSLPSQLQHGCQPGEASGDVLPLGPFEARDAAQDARSAEVGQLLRYKTSASAELSPLTFYADLEVSSDRPPSEAVERITHRLQRRVASAAYLSVGHNGYLPSRRCWLDVMRAEDGPYAVVERFLTSLLR